MELVLLHALPFDGSMWAGQQNLMPGATHAPTLYALGDTVSEWDTAVLDQIQGDRLIVANARLKVRYALARNERITQCCTDHVSESARRVQRPICEGCTSMADYSNVSLMDAWTRTPTAPI